MPALELECQLLVVDAETMQNRSLQVMHVHRVRDDVVRVVIGLAKRHAPLDSATRQPDGETTWVMISPVVVFSQLALTVDCPAELSTPHYQRTMSEVRLEFVDISNLEVVLSHRESQGIQA